MTSTASRLVAIAACLASVTACKTQNAGTDSATASDASASAGTTTSTGTTGTPGAGGGASIPTLVNVNLQNVLNDLSVSLQVNRNSIPVTAQVPIDVAASVCGVSVDALAASIASGNGSCTATTASAQLSQVVQQQISTGGSVTGGDQTTTVPTMNNMM